MTIDIATWILGITMFSTFGLIFILLGTIANDEDKKTKNDTLIIKNPLRKKLKILLIILPIFIISHAVTGIQDSEYEKEGQYTINEIEPHSNKYIIDNFKEESYYYDEDKPHEFNGIVKSQSNHSNSEPRYQLSIIDNNGKNKYINIFDKTQLTIYEVKNIDPYIIINKIKPYKLKYLGIFTLQPPKYQSYTYEIFIPE